MKNINTFILENDSKVLSISELVKEIVNSWGGEDNEDLIDGYVDEVESFVSGYGDKFRIVTNKSIINKLYDLWDESGGGFEDHGVDLRQEDVGQGGLLEFELNSKQYIGSCYGYDEVDWYECL